MVYHDSLRLYNLTLTRICKLIPRTSQLIRGRVAACGLAAPMAVG
jgi:hypothetical protein